jgi:hypothetical protein
VTKKNGTKIPRRSRIRDHELSERGLDLPCILQHRDHDPEPGCREHHGDQQWGAHEARALQGEPAAEPDRHRDGEAEPGQAEEPAAQTLVVDLEAGDQQEEGEAEERQHLDRLVRVGPTEHGGADEDPEAELQRHVRQPQARNELSQQRRDKGGSRHDCKARERDRVHGR